MKRRIRYSGTHPKRFSEKYKELNPEKYPDEIKKILAAGKTPAGSHRSIMTAEILKILNPTPGMTVVDCTLGYGGHTSEILPRITPGGKLFGLDLDQMELTKTEKRVRELGFSSDVFVPVHSNFARIPGVLNLHSLDKVDLVLADLGVSSMQIDNPERGFSFKNPGPLDMRLDPMNKVSAKDYLAKVKESELIEILEENSDEIFAPEIAKAILQFRKSKTISTTEDLIAAIQKGVQSLTPKRQKEAGDKPIRRVFQALRIAVNKEFESLELMLKSLPHVLKSGGRVAILTFHSGEDRRVKKAFQNGLRSGVYFAINGEIGRASPDEIFTNPRARSAKLRWAVRC